MNLKIQPAGFNKRGDSQLEKRTYLPFVLTSECPQCGLSDVRDLRDSYLSYPHVGVAEDVYFACANDHSWMEKVVIGFTLLEAGNA